MSAHPVSAPLRREWSADLTTEQLYELLRLRVEVFVVEQKCPYPELDGLDLLPGTRHFWIEGEDGVQAYLRLLESEEDGFRIGRVCTSASARGRGSSRRLVEAALAEVGDDPCTLQAQVPVAEFYTRFGFERTGEEYVEDGIPHIDMHRPGRNPA